MDDGLAHSAARRPNIGRGRVRDREWNGNCSQWGMREETFILSFEDLWLGG